MDYAITQLKAEACHIITHSWNYTPSQLDLAWRLLRQHRNR